MNKSVYLLACVLPPRKQRVVNEQDWCDKISERDEDTIVSKLEHVRHFTFDHEDNRRKQDLPSNGKILRTWKNKDGSIWCELKLAEQHVTWEKMKVLVARHNKMSASMELKWKNNVTDNTSQVVDVKLLSFVRDGRFGNTFCYPIDCQHDNDISISDPVSWENWDLDNNKKKLNIKKTAEVSREIIDLLSNRAQNMSAITTSLNDSKKTTEAAAPSENKKPSMTMDELKKQYDDKFNECLGNLMEVPHKSLTMANLVKKLTSGNASSEIQQAGNELLSFVNNVNDVTSTLTDCAANYKEHEKQSLRAITQENIDFFIDFFNRSTEAAGVELPRVSAADLSKKELKNCCAKVPIISAHGRKGTKRGRTRIEEEDMLQSVNTNQDDDLSEKLLTQYLPGLSSFACRLSDIAHQ